MKPGPRNLITDVAGLRVGNSEDHRIKTGTTVLIGDKPFVASVDVMGGAPGARDTELLAPDKIVDGIDAIVISGGSVFGFDAASGVTDALRKLGRGFRYSDISVPIVPAAILFDLGNRGDKNWTINPYRQLGEAAMAAASSDFQLGTAGAGTGALCAGLKGGLGSASLLLRSGHTVGALAAVNPTGSITVAEHPNFWAAPFEIDGEFGGLGSYPYAVPFLATSRTRREAENPVASTCIAIVATDAVLTKAQAKRLAVAAQDGIARATSPAHTHVDGDIVFSVATCARPIIDPLIDIMHIGHAAAVCLSRAMARGIYLATPATGDTLPTWQQKWGG